MSGKSKWFILLLLAVILWCAGATAAVIESSHPYESNTEKTWEYSHPTDAPYLKVTFSEDTETEEIYDFIYLTDAKSRYAYSGKELAGKDVILEGNSFTIELVSDNSVNHYGFAITSIIACDESGEPVPEETGLILGDDDGLINLTIDGGGTSTQTYFYDYDNYEFSLPFKSHITVIITNTSTVSNGLWSDEKPLIGLCGFYRLDVNGENVVDGIDAYYRLSKGDSHTYDLLLEPGRYRITLEHKYHGAYSVSFSGSYMPSFSESEVHIDMGESYALSVWSGNLSYTLKSLNESIAIVENNIVTGIDAGTTEIICDYSDGTTCLVTVQVANAEISSNKARILTHESIQLSLNHACGEVIWSSSNEHVATVDQTGKVTGLSEGISRIVATFNHHDYVCKVSVYNGIDKGEIENLFGKNFEDVDFLLRDKLEYFEDDTYTNGYFLVENYYGRIDYIALLTDAEYGPDYYTLFGTYPGMRYSYALNVLKQRGWTKTEEWEDSIYFSNKQFPDRTLIVTLLGANLDLIAYYGDLPFSDEGDIIPHFVIELPGNLKKIEAHTFTNIAADEIIIPSSVTTIEEDAIDKDVVLILPPDSTLEHWCKVHGYTYRFR